MNTSSLLRDVRRATKGVPADQVVPVAIATVLREMALQGKQLTPWELGDLAHEMTRERFLEVEG